MKRTAVFAALTIAAALAVPATALPAAADTSPSSPPGPPQRVVVLTPADASGKPPTMSADGTYTITSASGKALGTRDQVLFRRPKTKPTAAERLAGKGLPAAAPLPSALPSSPASSTSTSPTNTSSTATAAVSAADSPIEYSVQSYEDVNINRCMDDPATYGPDAVVRSHLFLCSGEKLTATAYSCWFGYFCEPVGWVDFTVTTIGRAQDPISGPRSVSLISLMTDVIPGGPEPELAEAFNIQLTTNCTPEAGLGSACENDNPQGLTLPMAEWITNQGGIPFSLTGPAADGVGADLLSFYDFNTQISLVGSNSTTFGAGTFRCDYGRAMNTPTGCVFPAFADRFRRMSLTDPTTTDASAHIWTALNTPDATNPPGVNKAIPGLESASLFLTRTVDSKINRANRRTAVAACRKYDPLYPDRKALTLQCDEYPFASTLEGASNAGANFSVREIPADQNKAGGNALNAWYNTFRILDGDRFYVVVRP